MCVPLTRRSSSYGAVTPDKITIFRGPLVRLYGHHSETLRREVRRVVLHEIAHHFGIGDERAVELDRHQDLTTGDSGTFKRSEAGYPP
jgi:predicted Zn-dependent protease with MMP-like domain